MTDFNIAVISDTHGLLRTEVIEKIKGSDLIIHAGDIGSPAILYTLKRIAPLKAIRGNIDGQFKNLPLTISFTTSDFKFFLIHNISEFKLNAESNNISAVIYGHSHKSKIENKNGVLYFNPGSAGPRRFKLPVSIGFIKIVEGKLQPEICSLNI